MGLEATAECTLEGAAMGNKGYFVDWDGHTRTVEAPGAGMSCEIVERKLNGAPYKGVDVLDHEGFVIHEATHYETLDALRAVGVNVVFAS
jgi:hypothetical protein